MCGFCEGRWKLIRWGILQALGKCSEAFLRQKNDAQVIYTTEGGARCPARSEHDGHPKGLPQASLCPLLSFVLLLLHSFRPSSVAVLVFCGTLCSVLGSRRRVASFIAHPTPPPETHHLVGGIRDRPATLMPGRVTCFSSAIGQWSLLLWGDFVEGRI